MSREKKKVIQSNFVSHVSISYLDKLVICINSDYCRATRRNTNGKTFQRQIRLLVNIENNLLENTTLISDRLIHIRYLIQNQFY